MFIRQDHIIVRTTELPTFFRRLANTHTPIHPRTHARTWQVQVVTKDPSGELRSKEGQKGFWP